MNKHVAEFVGTFALVFFGCGAAVIGSMDSGPGAINLLGIASAFGFAIVAMAYGGRWDIAQACRALAADAAAGTLNAADIDEARVEERLALAGIPDPDLLIRTGGEQRISNFLLWNLAYTELFFCNELWPEFSPAHLDAAFEYFGRRERRFGKTSGQLTANADA